MTIYDLTAAIDLRIDQRVDIQVKEATVISVTPAFAKVQVIGSKQTQKAYYDIRNPVSAGNSCVIVRPKTSALWIIVSSFSKTGNRETGGDQEYQLSPPSGFAVTNTLLGMVTASWNTPPQQDVTWQVQKNSLAQESGATDYIYTRGSYAIIPANSVTYVRVRAVNSAFQSSSWTDWASATPITDGTVTSVGLTVPSIFTAGSAVTTSGNLSFTLNAQAANIVFAGPQNGTATTPGFRSLVLADLPRGSISGQPLLAQGSSSAPTYAALSLAGGSSVVTGTLPQGNGGTGQSGYTDGDILVVNASGNIGKFPLGSNGKFLKINTGNNPKFEWGDAGAGSVTSVALTAPIEITVTGSPITGSGTFGLTWANETTNKVFAAPNGSTGTPTFRSLVAADIPSLSYMSSVALSAPVEFSVSGSPVTATGTLTLTWATEAANKVLAGPATGVDDTPAFRLLVAADIPALSYVTSVDISLPSFLSVSGNPVTAAGTLAVTLATQLANKVFAGPTTGSASAPTFRSLVSADIPALSYVTSVALTAPAEISVSGSPITASGTLALTWANESANVFFGGPTSGGATTPTFRILVDADGTVFVGITPATAARNTIQPSADVQPLTVKGKASQTANLQEWQDSSANILALVAASGAATFKPEDGATATVLNALTLGHSNNAAGTPATNFGVGLLFTGQDSTTADVNMGRLRYFWSTATHASRASTAVLSVYNVSTETDYMTVKINSSGSSYGEFGGVLNTAAKISAYVTNTNGTGLNTGLATRIDVASAAAAIGVIGEVDMFGANNPGQLVGIHSRIAMSTGFTGLGQSDNAFFYAGGSALTFGSGGRLTKLSLLSGDITMATGTIDSLWVVKLASFTKSSGSLVNFYGMQLPDMSSASTDNYGLKFGDFTGATNNYAIWTQKGAVSLLGDISKASATSATWKGIEFRAATLTLTGTAHVTTATGVNYIDIAQPTITDSSLVTVDNAATFYIANAPLAGGSVTITNPYALWIDAGASRFDGNIGFFATAPAAQQVSGANLTNNVTSGGTSDQIDNWTDLTTYAADAAAIRNAIYQLTRKVKQLNDGLRTFGMFT